MDKVVQISFLEGAEQRFKGRWEKKLKNLTFLNSLKKHDHEITAKETDT